MKGRINNSVHPYPSDNRVSPAPAIVFGSGMTSLLPGCQKKRMECLCFGITADYILSGSSLFFLEPCQNCKRQNLYRYFSFFCIPRKKRVDIIRLSRNIQGFFVKGSFLEQAHGTFFVAQARCALKSSGCMGSCSI